MNSRPAVRDVVAGDAIATAPEFGSQGDSGTSSEPIGDGNSLALALEGQLPSGGGVYHRILCSDGATPGAVD